MLADAMDAALRFLAFLLTLLILLAGAAWPWRHD
jgi:hypothetical protein